jgi:hypothetical protein
MTADERDNLAKSFQQMADLNRTLAGKIQDGFAIMPRVVQAELAADVARLADAVAILIGSVEPKEVSDG